MSFNLPKFFAQLKERLAAWRPLTAEIPHEYRDVGTEFRMVFSSLPWLTAVLFWLGLFLLSVAAGIGLKLAAESHLTIGHEDYRLISSERLYALNALREKALDAGARLPVEPRTVYPACDASTKDGQP